MSEALDRMSRVFTQREIQDKQHLEGIIEVEIEKIEKSRGNAGKALIEIRDRKLYQIEYDTFEEYGDKRWGKSRAWLYQQIQMHKVVETLPENLSTLVDTETKARALAPVPPRRRARVIQEAVESSNGAPTARDITAAAERVTAPKSAPTQPEQEIVYDATGFAVPENLVGLFGRSPEVKDVLNRIATIRGMLRRVEENKDALWQPVNASMVKTDLDRVYYELKMALPYVVCPHCQGRDETRSHCTTCKGRGALSEHVWKHAIPEELKAVRAKSCKK